MEEVNKNKTLNSGWEMATRLPAPYTQFPFICCKKWRFSPHFFFFKLFQLWHPTVGRLFQSKPFFFLSIWPQFCPPNRQNLVLRLKTALPQWLWTGNAFSFNFRLRMDTCNELSDQYPHFPLDRSAPFCSPPLLPSLQTENDRHEDVQPRIFRLTAPK